MQYVYGGAVCNISAIASKDCETGCFFQRDPSQLKPCEIQTEWNDRSNDLWMLHYMHYWEDAVEKGPLASRSWVLQELLLAPRILHLDDTQLFWKCPSLNACDAYPQGMPFNKGSSMFRDDFTIVNFGAVGSGIFSISQVQLQGLWREGVYSYSMCSLTY